MQKVIQEFTIGFYDSTGVFSIYAKQHDTGRMLKFHLQDLDEDYAELLNDNQIAITLREQLPNGKSIPDVPIDPSYIDKEELSISIPITKDMIQMAGTAICDLAFGSLIDETIISTVRFKLIIEEIFPVPESGYEREWFDNWTELYVKLKALEKSINEHETVREENEDIRISNESERQINEATRQDNEIDRNTAEITRDEAEQQREIAEQAREATGSGIIDTAHMWANGMAEGMDTPSATNNAMYYAGQAMAIAGLFTGTVAEWNALPQEEQAKIETVVFVDDNISGSTIPIGGYIDDMVGATSTTKGKHGLVPEPQAGDENKVLFGDGQWKSVDNISDMTGATSSIDGKHGLVPAPQAGDQDKILKGDGTWGNIDDMVGATSYSDGKHGLVPTPVMGDKNKILFGDGTFKNGIKFIERVSSDSYQVCSNYQLKGEHSYLVQIHFQVSVTANGVMGANMFLYGSYDKSGHILVDPCGQSVGGYFSSGQILNTNFLCMITPDSGYKNFLSNNKYLFPTIEQLYNCTGIYICMEIYEIVI